MYFSGGVRGLHQFIAGEEEEEEGRLEQEEDWEDTARTKEGKVKWSGPRLPFEGLIIDEKKKKDETACREHSTNELCYPSNILKKGRHQKMKMCQLLQGEEVA